MTNTTPSPDMDHTATASYDSLNRVTNLTATGSVSMNATYSSDQWGNAKCTSATGITCTSGITFNTNTNRIQTTGGYSYDAAGNMLTDGSGPLTFTYTWDGESRMKSAPPNGGGSAVNYIYNALGQRVQKKVGTSTYTESMYNPEGQVVGTHDQTNVSQRMFHFGGRVFAKHQDAKTYFVHANPLNSTTYVTDHAGVTVQKFLFGAYGEPWASTATTKDKRYAGMEQRETETDLDPTPARMYENRLYRWLRPDEPLVDQNPLDPQSWNLYAYVRNNPLANVDRDGRACVSNINGNSGFCQRAAVYASFDARVHDKTRFFAAASATSQALANVDVPILGGFGASQNTRNLLESTGQALLTLNTQVVDQVLRGQIRGGGSGLDAAIVHMEQSAVQKQLDALKKSDATGYAKAIGEINGLLNGNSSASANILAAVGGFVNPSDNAYAQILAGVRKALGRDIDFSNQGDREAIGRAVAQQVRDTGGCIVTDNKAQGCPR